MRRILFTETDFNTLPSPPAGFKYIGFDGPNFSQQDSNGTTANTGGGGGLSEVSYSEIVDLIDGDNLVAGSYYLINDFRTCYDRPDYDAAGEPKLVGNYIEGRIRPLIVFALSTNTISADAFQPDFPEDRIKYDFGFSQTDITGGTAYGRITERVDKYNNKTDYDHRDVRFKRYRSYEIDYSSPLSGTVSISQSDDTLGTVTGIDTLFSTHAATGSVVSISDFLYKVVEINSDTEMVVEGVAINEVFDVKYYLANNYAISYKEASINSYIMDGEVISGDASNFGISSQYFTNTYPGLFTLVAKNIGIESFKIDGNIGADGQGKVMVHDSTISFSGTTYAYYSKQVHGALDPSIIHIIIADIDGVGTSHTYDYTTGDDNDQVTGIGAATEIHYLLLSQHSGEPISKNRIEGIVSDYLAIAHGKGITAILSDLNSSYGSITDNVPDIYFFNDSGDGSFSSIGDGGGDMYDGSNEIYTNLSDGDYIEYTHTQMPVEELYVCLEYKENNIIGDYSREYRTFESGSHDNQITGLDIIMFDDDEEAPFLLSNNVLLSDSSFNDFSGNVYNNTFNDVSYNNVVKGNFFRNLFRRDASSNYLMHLNDNYIHDLFLGNTITDKFYSNKIYAPFNENNIKAGNQFEDYQDGFNNNEIYSSFKRNIIGPFFQYNTIGQRSLINSTSFELNNIGWSFKGNHILTTFFFNTVDQGVTGNEFWGDAYLNKIGFAFADNTMLGGFYSNEIGGDAHSNQIGENFQSNKIGWGFYNNVISQNFGFNTIANNFQNNQIENDFGYGASEARGNRIGDDFNYNVIGEYFYDNNIPHRFVENTVADNFKYNEVKSIVEEIDFTTYNGNILTYTWEFGGEFGGTLPNEVVGTTYSGVSGTYSYGGSPVSVVDATFDIYVTSTTSLVVTLVDTGKYYLPYLGSTQSEISISDSKFGGTGSNDLSIIVTSVSDLPSVYGEYNTEIFKRAGGDLRLSYYDETDVLTITDINR